MNLDLARRPFVRLNLAVSADGKIATANRRVSSFGSRRDLARLYDFRRQTDAILCGAKTIETEDADLGLGPGGTGRSRSKPGHLPLRVVVSGRGRIPLRGRLFRRRHGRVIILTTEQLSGRRLEALQALADTVKVFGARTVDFVTALRWLRKECQVRQLLCEGGSKVNAALLKADLVDEINLTLCPWIFGGRAAPTIAEGRRLGNPADAPKWRIHRVRRVQDELFLTYRRVRRGAGGFKSQGTC